MARKHYTPRGQPNKLKGDKRTARLYGKASRELGKELHGRAEGNLRKVPRLLERIYEPRRSSHLRVCVPPRSKTHDGSTKGYGRIIDQASEKTFDAKIFINIVESHKYG